MSQWEKKCLVYYINDYIFFFFFAFRVYSQEIYNLSWNWFYVMANSFIALKGWNQKLGVRNLFQHHFPQFQEESRRKQQKTQGNTIMHR